ncbi:MAG: 2-dehydropantoate 2-reductase [Deltaproteobacteria bacterium]|nr:2-dehydropantoate 2-reductase [Deltaproteobacteria bacterium]
MARIAVIGAGAVGCTIGALLKRAGQDVTLIGRPEQVAAICSGGLQLDGALGRFSVQVPVAEQLDFRPDLALLTVKTQDVVPAVQASLSFLTDVPLVTLQNGLRSDDLVAGVLPRHQIVSAVATIIATYLTPGSISIVSPGSLVIGHPFAATEPILPMVAEILNQAIPTRISANIRGAHWLKLLVNVNNALPAITNFTMQEVYKDPYLSQVAIRLVREGLAVVRRAGIKLESLPDVSVALFRILGRLPVRLAARLASAKVRRTVSTLPVLGSTLQSLRRHRSTEIDYLNGEIVRLGTEVGVPTPLNAMVVKMVHRVEKQGRYLGANAIREAIVTRGS